MHTPAEKAKKEDGIEIGKRRRQTESTDKKTERTET